MNFASSILTKKILISSGAFCILVAQSPIQCEPWNKQDTKDVILWGMLLTFGYKIITRSMEEKRKELECKVQAQKNSIMQTQVAIKKIEARMQEETNHHQLHENQIVFYTKQADRAYQHGDNELSDIFREATIVHVQNFKTKQCNP
jgi:hypothetical protein